MVMDATPSPQSVGREFVRQYYTLLNKAPDHLHRFYNNHSSFVHGGLDVHNREATMVIGQKQIYTKIQQLNFHDCHAKISQVDAQSTLGNGVVVQVTGELSNDGQPMRRFTQTFVLGAQSPKKYYVHNDIFRYQDLYSDDEADNESGGGRSENGEDGGQVDQQQLQQQQQPDGSNVVDSQQQQLLQQQQQQQQIYYPVGVVPGAGPNQSFVPQQLNGGGQHDELVIQQQQQAQQQHQQQQQQQQQQQVSQSIQTVPQPIPVQHAIPSNDNAATTAAAAVAQLNISETETATHGHNLTDDSYDRTTLSSSEQEHSIEEPINVVEAVVEPVREEVVIPKNIPAEPKTYANLFKSEVSSGISFASAMASNPPTASSTSSTGQARYGMRPAGNDAATRPGAGAAEPAAQSARPAAASSRPVRPALERRPSNAQLYGDNHQLFLGNVPHHATEDELSSIFNKFGTVVDLRIHSKPGPKVTGGVRAPPNYGFITYDDPEAVKNCLAHMPLYYPENSPDGQKLNVEEKKTRNGPLGRDDRDRGGMGGGNRNMSTGGGGGSNGGGIRMGGGGNNGPRSGGPSGGGGIMRSGAGGPPGGGSNGPRGSGPPGGRGPFNRSDNRGPAPGGAQRGGGGNGGQTGGSGGGGVSGSGSNAYGRR